MHETQLRSARAVLDDVAAAAHAQMGAENFPVALRLLPRRVREQLVRVYGFARFVDDVGDEAPGDRVELLSLVRAELQGQYAGATSALAPVRELAAVFAADVALQPFDDLVEANLVDQRVDRYETFDDLLGYCALSAAPVGRVVLQLAGAATPRNVANSDAVCAALQVLEHCQDVGEDARAGRVYLPQRDLDAAGITRADLLADSTSLPLRTAIAMQVDRAADLLTQARPLVRRLPGWARVAVAGFAGGGLATVDALRHADHDVLSHAVRPTRFDTARHAIRLVRP